MTFRKRRNPTPGFNIPPPYEPLEGIRAPLKTEGIFPYCAMFQVATEDTEDDYVLCRGFDIRISKFIDYEADNEDKPGIPVAKPYDCRVAGIYTIGQIFAACLPLQSPNPSPTAVDWRVGQNPGVAETSTGHPASLSEKVEELYTKNDEKLINWMFLQAPDPIVWAKIMEEHPGNDICFNITIGTWNSGTNTWEFDCDTGAEGYEYQRGIDFHYGAPTPAIYACGWFRRMPSDTTASGVIYHVISLDCESRGSCANLTSTGC